MRGIVRAIDRIATRIVDGAMWALGVIVMIKLWGGAYSLFLMLEWANR